MKSERILEVQNLYKLYPLRGGFFMRTINHVKAVTDVSFNLNDGETLGLVGESGCGKSTLGRSLIYLETPTSGKIVFKGNDLSLMDKKRIKAMRENFQIIFQDPFSSLNPKMTVYKLISEPLTNFKKNLSKSQINAKVYELMKDVGLRPEYTSRYPHEFSGGQRQRISIARALASGPKLIICDEPVSALDVSIQAQILNLLLDLQDKYGLSYIFISHDLHVVRHISNRIAVMYLGRFVEVGSNDEIYRNPLHPYTKVLLSAAPVAVVGRNKKKKILEGDVPSPIDPPTGCYFHPRCRVATEECKHQTPPLKDLGNGHLVACLKCK